MLYFMDYMSSTHSSDSREGDPSPGVQALVPTPATTIDEIMKAAYFVATGIDAPVCDVISPHQVNLHFPADGSLVSVKIEGRPGAWGGIGPHGTPEEEADRNAHYDELSAAAAPPPEGGVTAREGRRESPVYEVGRQ